MTARSILLALVVIVLAAILGGTWAFNNYDEEAEEGWSREFRMRWYRYLADREERFVLAPDDKTLEPEFTDEANLTFDWFTEKSPAWAVALEPYNGQT